MDALIVANQPILTVNALASQAREGLLPNHSRQRKVVFLAQSETVIHGKDAIDPDPLRNFVEVDVAGSAATHRPCRPAHGRRFSSNGTRDQRFPRTRCRSRFLLDP